MAISSIHIQAASSHCFAHNDRSEKVSYLVDDSSLNECNRDAKSARDLLANFVKDAEKYRKDNGLRAMKSDTIKSVEAVVNLNAGHTLKDVERLAVKLENEFGFRAVQIAVHRDEGKDRQNKNYHAHIVMCNLTLEGKTILRSIGKDGLSKLQDITARELKMSRGDPERKAPRLTAKEYKKHAKAQENNENQMQEIAEKLKKEKQENEKTLRTLLEAQKEVRAYQTLTHTLKMQNKALSDANKALSEENKSLKNELELLKAMYNEDRSKLKESGTATQKDYQELKRAYDDLKLENELLKSRDTEDMLKAFVEAHDDAIHAHTPKLG